MDYDDFDDMRQDEHCHPETEHQDCVCDLDMQETLFDK